MRFKFSRTSFETLPLIHFLTPSQLQRSVPRHGIEFEGSMDDFKLSRASTSLDLTREVKKKASIKKNIEEEEIMMESRYVLQVMIESVVVNVIDEEARSRT